MLPRSSIDGALLQGKISEDDKFYTLQAKTAEGVKRDLVFTDYAMASRLIHWLKAHPSGALQEMEFPDYKGQTLVPYENVGNDCELKAIDLNRENKESKGAGAMLR
jgi:hypothetical protein